MKKIFLLLVIFIAGSSSFAANATECPHHFAGRLPPAFLNEKLANKAIPLCFEDFAVTHSGVSRTPLWAAQHLTQEKILDAKKVKRRNAFHPEDRLPASHRAELSDYARSGFDRGHLSPAADMASERAQYESFSLANIVPQDPHNNQNLWAGIEESIRQATRRSGELYVITGPIFEGAAVQRIKGRVLVPTHMFKAVYFPARQQAAAYVAPNAPGFEYEVVPIAELERRIGINLFPAIPQKVKESRTSLPEPKTRKRNRAADQRDSTFQLQRK